MLLFAITAGLIIGFFTIRWLFGLLTINDYESRYVFISGCDSGFGSLLAKRLDSMGFHVFAACLTTEGAKTLKQDTSSRLITVDLDVTDEQKINDAFKLVCKELPENTGLWALINNAGIPGAGGPSEWFPLSETKKVMEVNLYGMMELCRTFLPLIRRERGRIVNCSSFSGRFAFGAVAYCISKFGVEAFSDCLRRELYKEGISVHIIEPLTFKTPIIQNVTETIQTAFNQISPEMQTFYGKSYLKQVCEMTRKLMGTAANPNTSLVVDDYVHAVTSRFPRARYMPGDLSKYFLWLFWNLPECISDRIVTILMPKPAGAI